MNVSYYPQISCNAKILLTSPILLSLNLNQVFHKIFPSKTKQNYELLNQVK